MQFEYNKLGERVGEKAGYVFSYFLFTTLLFLILLYLDKLRRMNYLQVMGITLLIVTIGAIIRRLLR
ncbi:hypothetical protein KY358_01810 [Candidatus Woesearchaeota archaeon]|nr:hypothetical protein [Candidatus Woesearchaeota archaeon]